MSRPVIAVGLAVLVAACTLTAVAPEPGKPMPVAGLCDQADGTRVRLDGYVRYRRGMLSFCHASDGKTTDCDLALYAEAAQPVDFNPMAPAPDIPEPLNVGLTLKIGTSPGQMADMPHNFSASDVKVHLDGGTVAGDGDHVLVDGVLRVVPVTPGERPPPKVCWVDVDWAKPVPQAPVP